MITNYEVPRDINLVCQKKKKKTETLILDNYYKENSSHNTRRLPIKSIHNAMKYIIPYFLKQNI